MVEGSGTAIGTRVPFEVITRRRLQDVELLTEPSVQLHGDVALRILATGPDPLQERESIPIAYVSTKAGHSPVLDEFSGRPTGESMPCNAVKGFIGGNKVYNKNVSTDMPLSGLRTALAQRRAARSVRTRLNARLV